MPSQTIIPPTGNIAATDRKESAQDSEIIAGTTSNLPATIRLYQNFAQFQNTTGNANVEAKQRYRDTNLGGPGGALPQGYQLLWFEWRCGPRTLGANLNTVLASGVTEQLERIRETGYLRILFSQSPLITANLRDLVAFTDSRFVTSTFGGTQMAPVIAERGGKVVALGNEPFKIVGLEQLEVEAGWPGNSATPAAQGGPLAALVPYYLFCSLDGVLSRASV